MKFSETKIPGVFEISIEPKTDERGFFARTWCQKEFESHGLNPKLVQCSISFNTRQGNAARHALSGRAYAEAKLVRCTRGAIYRRGARFAAALADIQELDLGRL